MHRPDSKHRAEQFSFKRRLIAAPAAVAVAAGVAAILLAPGDAQPHRAATAPLPRRPADQAPKQLRRLVIGRSVRRRPIYAIDLGSRHAVRTILVIGCIHGNETAGIAITRRLVDATTPPPSSAIWIVPNLNPDGAMAGTRQNADGVDLNRNFPWHWRPLGTRGDMQYSGPRPLSEPETRAAYQLILRVRPQATIWFHQPEALVDLSGADAAIEHEFANLVGLPTSRLARYPGSAINWENTQLPGSTAFDVELPPSPLTEAAIARYTTALLALAKAATRHPQTRSTSQP